MVEIAELGLIIWLKINSIILKYRTKNIFPPIKIQTSTFSFNLLRGDISNIRLVRQPSDLSHEPVFAEKQNFTSVKLNIGHVSLDVWMKRIRDLLLLEQMKRDEQWSTCSFEKHQ